jgi:predicted kinase
MRKWMRERLQRGKKKAAEPSDQPAPPPLQPAYFEAEQTSSAAADAAAERSESETSIQPEPPPEPASQPRPVQRARATSDEPPSEQLPSEEQSAAQGSGSMRTSNTGRGRRRRGGRGRGGRGREQAVAQAFAPAAGKGTIPAVPVDAAEEESADTGEEEAPSAAPVVAAAPKAQPTPAAAQRPPKGVVVLAIGLPGSGKSSWFKRHNVVPLSSDMVRSLLFDDVREQRFQDLVFSNLRSLLKARLIAKRPMNYVDATNLTPQERQHWIKLAKDYQYEVHAVFFDVPLEVCIERHQRRDRVVPEDVMRRMAAKLKPPAFEEGIAKITVVRVKKKGEASPAVASEV